MRANYFWMHKFIDSINGVVLPFRDDMFLILFVSLSLPT